MKFLGLRLDEHDSNITYTDGFNVKYFKPERHNQIKHFGYNNLYDWVFSSFYLNFKLEDLDAVAIVLDTHLHPFIKRDKSKLYQTVDINLKPFTNLKCPVFVIDHHLAHVLSCWMLTENNTTDFVLDGFGDYFRSVSVFKKEKPIKNFTTKEVVSFGSWLGDIGRDLKIEGHPDDLAGKLMALKSFGQIDKDVYKLIHNINYEDSRTIFFLEHFLDKYQNNGVLSLNLINVANSNETITYSGGVAHNVCVNTQLRKNFPNIVIPPHCADEGLSLGCVEFLRKYFEQPKFSKDNFPFWQSDVAPLNKPNKDLIKKTAEDLAQGKIIGWYQGHGEIGPRALGNRSILMSPEVKNGKDILNKKVKHREVFRPFAASILEEDTKDYFDWKGKSEFMKFSVKFKDKIFKPISHIDNTSRIQTVNQNKTMFYSLIKEFKKLTGIPMLLNTSLNDNGKPIAGKPEDALNLLNNSELDKLIIGDIVYK
jgi:carbamoyltransferase